MINLEKHNSKRVNGYSSKGNVPKWKIGDNWYKLDVFGYEGLAEFVISHLIKKSNVDNFVLYDLEKALYRDEKVACVSKNFLKDDEELITIERLHLAEIGVGLNKKLTEIDNIKEKIVYLVDFVESITKLKDFHIYFTKMLELDMFFLNEDRHTNNIAVIKNNVNKKFKFAPIFDNGLSLLSDVSEYKMDSDVYKTIQKVKSKPFTTDFEEQVETIEKLYKDQLQLKFNKKDVDNCLDKANEFYSKEIVERVRSILYKQMKKYEYLIKE